MIDVVNSLFVLVLTVAALVDIITRSDGSIQHLPKLLWILLVILLPVIGGILWFAVGRSYQSAGGNGGGRYAEPFHRGDVEQQKSLVAETRVRTTEQELADLDHEIELYEKQARLKQLRSDAGDAPQ
jgi:hypothetical protein